MSFADTLKRIDKLEGLIAEEAIMQREIALLYDNGAEILGDF